jgi:hypothetical protein
MEQKLNTSDIMLTLEEMMKFIDWCSDKSYKRCANGEWIQTGTGDYKTVANNTIELYQQFKNKI